MDLSLHSNIFEMKKCPFCGEKIQDAAKKCRFCGEWIKKNQEKGTDVDDLSRIKNMFRLTPQRKSLLRKLFRFSKHNRIGRLEFVVSLFVPMIILSLLLQPLNYLGSPLYSDTMPAIFQIMFTLLLLPVGLYGLFIFWDRAANRLHDINSPGRLILIPLLNNILFIFLFLMPGSAGPNKYGPSPRNNGLLMEEDHIPEGLHGISSDEDGDGFDIDTKTILIVLAVFSVAVLIMWYYSRSY